jgi:TolA-binding protein
VTRLSSAGRFGFILTVLCALNLQGCAAPEETVKKSQGYYQEGIATIDSDKQKAFVSFQKAIQTNPKNKEARYGLGHLLASQGKWAQAEEQFRAALDVDPDYSEAHTYLFKSVVSNS